MDAGQGGSHLLALGLQGGAVGKGDRQGLLQAEAGDAAGLKLLGGGQIQGRTGHRVGGLNRTGGGLVDPDQVGWQLRCAEHVAHRGLGLARQQPIERPQLRIQPLPAALDQFGGFGWPRLAWKWCWQWGS